MKKILLLLVLPLLTHCGSTTVSSASSSTWMSKVNQRALGLNSSANLTQLPILKSASLASSWGTPKMESSATAYRLTYTHPSQPFNRLLIYGYKTPLSHLTSPPDVSGEDMINGELTAIHRPQAWRLTQVAGKSVRWFQESLSSGADGAYFSTEGFTLPSKGSGHYRVVMEGAAKDFPARLRTLSVE